MKALLHNLILKVCNLKQRLGSEIIVLVRVSRQKGKIKDWRTLHPPEPKQWSPSQAFVLGYRPLKLGYAVKLSSQLIKPICYKSLKNQHITLEKSLQSCPILLGHHPLRLLNYGSRIYILFSLFWFGFSDKKAKSRTESLLPPGGDWNLCPRRCVGSLPTWTTALRGSATRFSPS